MMVRIQHLTKVSKEFTDAPLGEKQIDRRVLGPFVRSYVACALRETVVDNFFGKGPLSDDYSIDDIEDRVLAQMIRDCLNFYWKNAADFEEIYTTEVMYNEKEAGSDFWLSRHGKGGYEERGWEDAWDNLGKCASKTFGPFPLIIGENGKITYGDN